MYNPKLGVWLQRDPAEEGQNLYEYCSDSPTMNLDPTGLYELKLHVSLSEEAAVAAGYSKDDDKDFFCGLAEGSQYPDIPEGITKAGVVLRVTKKNDGSLTGRSHYGDLQYWHSMAVPGKTAKANQEAIVDWIVSQYQKALDAEDSKTAGIEIGKALHTLEDSYSLSHTARQVTIANGKGNWARGNRYLGPITRFQNYAVQNPTRHGTADVANDKDPMNVMSRADAFWQATRLLVRLREKRDKETVRKFLTEGDEAPFLLAPSAENGGTEFKYSNMEGVDYKLPGTVELPPVA